MPSSEVGRARATDGKASKDQGRARAFVASSIAVERWSISRRLMLLVLALAIPLNIVIFSVVWRLADAAANAQRTSLLYTARSIAAGVDAQIGKYVALAQSLSSSPGLYDDNLDAFQTEARKAFASIPDAWTLVSDLGGQQLMNTARLPGQPLPRRNPVAFATQQRALATRAVAISDVLMGAVRQDWIVNVEVPIYKSGQPFRSLTVTMPSQAILRLLNESNIPKNWQVGILDRQGQIIAHVPVHAHNAGQPAPAGWRDVKDADGVFEINAPEGNPIVIANAHATLSNWAVGVAIKKAELEAATWNAVRWAALLGGGLSFFSVALAGLMARRISAPIDALREKAAQLLKDPSIKLPPGPPEVVELGQALQRASAARQQSDATLRAREEHFRLLVEQADDGIFVADAGGCYTDVNSAGCAMLGYTRDEIIGRTISDVITQEEVARLPAELPRFAGGSVVRSEWRFRRKDGSTFVGEVVARRLPDGRLQAILRDISERKHVEDTLRASRQSLQIALDVANMAVWGWDECAHVKRWTPQTKAIFGLPPETEMSKPLFLSMLHPDDIPRYEAAWAAALDPNGSRIYQLEYRIVRASDSSERWISSKACVDFEGERPVRFIGAMRDITDERHAEQALRASEERLRIIIDTAVDAMVVVDEAGLVQSVNPATGRIFGYDRTELVGRSVTMLMPASHWPLHVSNAEDPGRTGQATTGGTGREVEGRRKDGTIFPAELAVAEWTVDGRRYCTAMMRDISERRKREDQIQLLLREVNHRAKNMLGVVQAIAWQTNAADRGEFVERFSERLQALAANQDLLVKNQWRGIDLDELVQAQVAHFADPAGRRISSSGPSLRITAGAAQQIAMALHELATNASKYGALSNANGEVKIAWGIDGHGSDERFQLDWRESGGPPVIAPTRRGFGTTVMIDMPKMQLSAVVTLDYAPSGIAWHLNCPADKILEGSSEANNERMAVP